MLTHTLVNGNSKYEIRETEQEGKQRKVNIESKVNTK